MPMPLQRLLRPRSIAIVGASPDRMSPGNNALANLDRAGYAGALHLVSRTRSQIDGRTCLKSIDDLPDGVDAVILIVPAQAVRDAVEACVRRGIWYISDEIYHGLTYGMPAATALQFSDQAIIINSFSKYFSMTGWRVGWMVVPDGLVRTVERLAQNLYISPPAVAQVAALGAFDGMDELLANKRVYEANRDLLLAGLPKAGLTRIVPADGAFYLYADVGHVTDDALAFARTLLDETGIAATPGVDFDEARGRRFLRFSYAGATADMAEAVDRLQRWGRLQA